MFKVYVIKQRKGGSEVLAETRTYTPSFDAAVAAWWSLYESEYSDRHLLLMTRDGKQINAYRFGSSPGDSDYVSKGEKLNGK